MKRPNGSGSIIKLSGNRRRSFGARLTVGFNKDTGYPIYKFIGYAESWDEANAILVRYSENRYDLDRADITTEELYNLLLEKRADKFAQNTLKAWKKGFNHIKPLHSMRYRAVRAYHMRDCINARGKGYATQGHVKGLLCQLDRLALEYEVINICYSALVSIDKTPPTSKKPFAEGEIKSLWANIDKVECADLALFLIYTGLRADELLNLKKENVDLANSRLYISKSKTESGMRYVPLHSKIVPLVEGRYESDDSEYLFDFGTQNYMNLYYRWKRLCKSLSLNHNPHDARHTLRSRLDSAGANKVCIDLMMGHKSKDVGERTYTHKTFEEIRSAMELIVS